MSRPAENRKQFSSFLLFFIAIVLVNLCPIHPEVKQNEQSTQGVGLVSREPQTSHGFASDFMATHFQTCLGFVRLIFSNPMRLERRTTRFSVADAKVLGKMAKVWYIKKKIKKLGKKLKKHTIAVPVFTAIPVYEHSFYPHQAQHLAGHMHQHAAAASAYLPVMAVPPMAGLPGSSAQVPATTDPSQAGLAAAASNSMDQLAAYRMSLPKTPQTQQRPSSYLPQQATNQMYRAPAHTSAANQIINAYAPAPPVFVDDTSGIYGTYGNAYGRYDGGYHIW